jgi:hypothetical protein
MTLRKGGKVYALETDKAIDHVSADTDWIFYIQADEVIHEKYHTVIRQTAEKYVQDKRVDGFLFKYLHFYGTYDYVGDSRKWYKDEIRIIRNDRSIHSYRDAQGFRRGEEKLDVVRVEAEVYHYGWVKSPEQMKKKLKNIQRFYHADDKQLEAYMNGPDFFDYSEFDALRKFTGTHPQVMQQRIASRNWHVELDINKKQLSFKDSLLHAYEKFTGKRLFAFKNYRNIIK